MKKAIANLKKFVKKEDEVIVNFDDLKITAKILYGISFAWNSTLMLERVINDGYKINYPYNTKYRNY